MLLVAVAAMASAQTYVVMHNFGTTSTDPQAPGEPGVICQSRGGYLFKCRRNPGEPGRSFPAHHRRTLQGDACVHRERRPDANRGAHARTGRMVLRKHRFRRSGTWGTLYKMRSNGQVKTLHYYSGGDGGNPWAAPIQSVAGDFYSVTHGSFNYGQIVKIFQSGQYTMLHSMTLFEGVYQVASLVQGTDFAFYGAAIDSSGTASPGDLYRITSTGIFEVLYTFDGTQGNHPAGGLIQATDGNFYGVASEGGSYGAGTVFQMTPDHTVNVLYNFSGGADGGGPVGGMVEASDGNLYGTTSSGGANGAGVLFRLTTSGSYTVLHDFAGATGSAPRSSLMQHTNGRLYGMTSSGGSANFGVFFSLDAGLPPFVTYLPTYGRAGGVVQILGQGFTDTTQVFFNGTPASFKLVYPTFIKATIPDGATTGPITVSTTNGTLTSNKVFIVHP